MSFERLKTGKIFLKPPFLPITCLLSTGCAPHKPGLLKRQHRAVFGFAGVALQGFALPRGRAGFGVVLGERKRYNITTGRVPRFIACPVLLPLQDGAFSCKITARRTNFFLAY